MSTDKRKRIYLTLNEDMRRHLERWAKKEKRPAANMATFLVERAIEEAIENGTLESSNSDEVALFAAKHGIDEKELKDWISDEQNF